SLRSSLISPVSSTSFPCEPIFKCLKRLKNLIVTPEKNISRRSDLWSPTERRRDERAKETQRARAT
ncbi:hypothetical protein, partial [Brevibacillus porteri]|uniref:hypothetical protein n=1 Tax=Brevibacillus porteri TaxID=2126350 RepID=UPI003D1F79AA